MSTAVSDYDFAALVYPVYDAVFVVYMPRPPAGQVAAKLFRVINAVIWVAVYILDELIEPFQDFFPAPANADSLPRLCQSTFYPYLSPR
jgi:hypothetical protein